MLDFFKEISHEIIVQIVSGIFVTGIMSFVVNWIKELSQKKSNRTIYKTIPIE